MSSLAGLSSLVGFFSYSRQDDDGFGGALTDFRVAIEQGIGAQLGRTRDSFRIWQDRAAIPSDDAWQGAIRRRIGQSVFFIPIITPRYAQSEHCAFELEAFLAREVELGRDDLIFPILYVPIPDLDDGSGWTNHPVLRIINSRQFLDWRRHRHRDLADSEVQEKIIQFCGHVAFALRKPWESSEERAQWQTNDAEISGRNGLERHMAAMAEPERARQRADEEVPKSKAATGVFARAATPVAELERMRAASNATVVSLESEGASDLGTFVPPSPEDLRRQRTTMERLGAEEQARSTEEATVRRRVESVPLAERKAPASEVAYARAAEGPRRKRVSRLAVTGGAIAGISGLAAYVVLMPRAAPPQLASSSDPTPSRVAPSSAPPVPPRNQVGGAYVPIFRDKCLPIVANLPVFQDEFRPPRPGWGPDSDQTFMDAGGLVIRPKRNQTIVRLFAGLKIESLAELCAQLIIPAVPAENGGTDSAGLVFWAANTADYYSAMVFPTGEVALQRTTNGVTSMIVPRQKSSKILSAPNPNQIQVSLGKNGGVLIVNGSQQFNFAATPPNAQSSFGLSAHSGPQSTAWHFPRVAIFNASLAPQVKPQRRTKSRVDVSVFSRSSGSPGDSLLVRVLFHQPKERAAVARSARGADPQAERRVVRTLQTDVHYGQELEVRLAAEDLKIDDPIQKIIWNGLAEELPFVVTLPTDAGGRSYAVTAHLLLDAVFIGKIGFTIDGLAAADKPVAGEAGMPPTDVTRFRRAFISYAHQDRMKALDAVLFLRAAGLEVFQDVESLRAGDDWWEKIKQNIDDSHIFFLFWSQHAASSETVRKEAIYAYEKYVASGKQKPQVTPILLEGPPPPLPPPELSSIHFNDPTRYIIAAEAQARMARMA